MAGNATATRGGRPVGETHVEPDFEQLGDDERREAELALKDAAAEIRNALDRAGIAMRTLNRQVHLRFDRELDVATIHKAFKDLLDSGYFDLDNAYHEVIGGVIMGQPLFGVGDTTSTDWDTTGASWAADAAKRGVELTS